jgi:hypothetical protein
MRWVYAMPVHNKSYLQWRGSGFICSLVFQIRFVSWDSDALRTPATAYAQPL